MAIAALMMTAAMAMTSCASSKKINGDSNASKSNDMGKNEEDLDNSYLVLLYSVPKYWLELLSVAPVIPMEV